MFAQQEEISGSNVTIICPLSGTFTLPKWSGPPGSTVYIQQGQETNPSYAWVHYADNNRDLLLIDVKPEHSGDYSCEDSTAGTAIISLKVLGKNSYNMRQQLDCFK